ncbi:MAG: choice-of-anchor I family protein [Cyanobacteriota bacterium]
MTITLSTLGTYTGNGAEIPAFDPITQRIYVVTGSNVMEVLDASNPSNPNLLTSIDISAFGSANSVTVKNGIVAVAVANEDAQAPGMVVFYDLDGNFLNAVTVGSLPDMLTFTPDGKKIIVANEGEPSSYNQPDSVDPEGSVSIIDLSNGVFNLSQSDITTADFTAFNSQKSALMAQGVRIFGPNATVAQDVEPEYITISSDSKTAWITLQENNAIAVLDLQSGQITDIKPLGYKNHNLSGNGLDASDRDSGININNGPVLGMYQPDAIASFTVNGQTYLITANEGDARDYDGFSEEERVKDLDLDPTAFPNAEDLQDDAALGRLNVTSTLGDTDGDGDYDKLYAFGARSFSIWTAQGNLVYDSGDDLEQITAAQIPLLFNSEGTTDSFDSRSDNKGPEPEGVVTGVIAGRTYAFIGLERTGGVMVYDVTNPTSPDFIEYINTPGDFAPEGLVFVSSEESPTGKPLLVASNEESGTTTTYEITTDNGKGNKLVIKGNAGNNTLNGENQGEIFYGFAGKDLINAGEGNNNLYGGDGNDTLNSGAGDDIANGGKGNDIINAGEGNNQIYAGDGNDRITAGAGEDVIYGGNGSDQIYAGEGVNTIFAGAGGDLIYAGSKADSIDAGAGSDRIYAGEGNNTIRGGAGNDIIYSGSGCDRIDAGPGNDTIWLGGGQDIVVLAQGNGVDTINNFQLSQTKLGLSGGLVFNDLAITQVTGATLIEIAATGEDLTSLSWVQASSINANSFVIV